jgi:F-type H+-transporting ATPase subunit b
MLKLDWNIIFNMINVFVLFLLLKKYLFGPVNEIMEKRANAVKASLEEADNKNKEASMLKSEYEEALKNAQDKAIGIITDAKQRALEQHDKQMIETKEEAARLIEDAKKAIETERKLSMQAAQSEIAGIAILAASKVLQKNVDENTDKQIINDFLAEAGAGK